MSTDQDDSDQIVSLDISGLDQNMEQSADGKEDDHETDVLNVSL